jgi:pimeloyl-ACP methyl ester carboxylesterase
MAKALNILITHGIGWGEGGKNYARSLQQNIGREFERAVRRLRLRDVDKRDSSAKRALRFEAVYWAPVTQDPQNALLDLMKLKGFRPMNWLNLTYQARKQLVSLLGDVIAYESGGANLVYKAIHERVDDCARTLSERSADDQDDHGYAPLTIIGHSLGSVIASDYVWDHTRGAVEPHYLTDHRLSLKNLVLLGSPMALYALRNNPSADKKTLAVSLDSPVQVDPDGGLWLNIYDRQDPIAFPLRPIKSYADVGVIDCTVQSGNWLTSWNLASHTEYWNSPDVARLVAQKLALDWAELNSPSFAGDRYAKAVEDFRKTLGK